MNSTEFLLSEFVSYLIFLSMFHNAISNDIHLNFLDFFLSGNYCRSRTRIIPSIKFFRTFKLLPRYIVINFFGKFLANLPSSSSIYRSFSALALSV